jgi:hypothetical protein
MATMMTTAPTTCAILLTAISALQLGRDPLLRFAIPLLVLRNPTITRQKNTTKQMRTSTFSALETIATKEISTKTLGVQGKSKLKVNNPK